MLNPSSLCLLLILAPTGRPEDQPTIPDVAALPHPRIAATSSELARLRSAYAGSDRNVREVVNRVVREADQALKQPMQFPPRGGQHNQWYQCDTCQIALKTIDATDHQCPQCKRVYSGEPYDDVIFSRIHSRNLNAILSAAWAYALTEETKYARFAADGLLGYAERYRNYPYHSAGRGNGSWDRRAGGHLFEQTLTEASALASSIAPAYDLISTGSFLSDEQKQTIREGLLEPMVTNIGKNRSGKSNWQTWHNAAMLAAGAVLGDRSWIERAIRDPGNGFLDQMTLSVSDDGMWYENSWGYHFYTLKAMIHIVEYSRRLGIDLWRNPRLKSMFTVAIDYVMPNGRLPRFGDDVNTSIGSVSYALEFAYHAYQSPAMIPYLPNTPTWDSIMMGRTSNQETKTAESKSHVFPAAGHAIARVSGPKALATVVTFGPYGGFHGHFDKLSFVFYGLGKEWGVDPGRARSQAYRLPIHRNWYKATLSHNAVVVDKKSQSPAAGRLLYFDSTQDDTVIVVQCDGAYKGVVHTRLLYQTADYLLVFDDLKSNVDHRFDWFYHNRGKLAQCSVATKPLKSSDAGFAGMKFVRNIRQGDTDGPICLTFTTDDLKNSVMIDGHTGTSVLLGDGVGASIVDRVPLVRLTRQGTTSRFAVVLEPLLARQSPTVQSVTWRNEEGRLHIAVKRVTHYDIIDVDDNFKKIERTSQSMP